MRVCVRSSSSFTLPLSLGEGGRGLFFFVLFDDGVSGGAKDGHGRTDHPEFIDWVAEEEDGREDDDDAFHRVGNGVGYGGNLAEGEESDLVVKVIEKTGDGEQLQQVQLRVAGCERGGPCCFHGCRAFNQEGGGEDEKKAQNGEHCKHVGGCEVLAQWLAVEDFLAEDRFRGGGDGAQGAGSEAQPSEGHFLQRGEADAADDGQKAQVDGYREEFFEPDSQEKCRPHWLSRLEDVGE
mmetsp:Transcript_7431/g.15254  ORF Transcript_7431/g.15254 Transcript_7431/m.15254 type:complete len:237 (+) Transcript_7431:80-790(+)